MENKKKILIVEDEELLGEMYRKKLSDSGFKAIWASTTKEALYISEKESPDLILLDVLLPDENGISFLEKIRKQTKLARTKVVIFSNLDDPQIREKAKKLKAEDYIIKTNITPKKMVEKIKDYLLEEN